MYDLPAGWDQANFDRQSHYGRGASRMFNRPPSPDAVAPRGTPEWNAAYIAQHDWQQRQLNAGATLMDMGFAPRKEHGLHAYTALRMGDFNYAPNQRWSDQADSRGRVFYDPVTGAMRSAGGPTGGGFAPTSYPGGGQPGPGGMTVPSGIGNDMGLPGGSVAGPTGASTLAPTLPGSDVSTNSMLIRRGRSNFGSGLRGLAGG